MKPVDIKQGKTHSFMHGIAQQKKVANVNLPEVAFLLQPIQLVIIRTQTPNLQAKSFIRAVLMCEFVLHFIILFMHKEFK